MRITPALRSIVSCRGWPSEKSQLARAWLVSPDVTSEENRDAGSDSRRSAIDSLIRLVRDHTALVLTVAAVVTISASLLHISRGNRSTALEILRTSDTADLGIAAVLTLLPIYFGYLVIALVLLRQDERVKPLFLPSVITLSGVLLLIAPLIVVLLIAGTAVLIVRAQRKNREVGYDRTYALALLPTIAISALPSEMWVPRERIEFIDDTSEVVWVLDGSADAMPVIVIDDRRVERFSRSDIESRTICETSNDWDIVFASLPEVIRADNRYPDCDDS